MSLSWKAVRRGDIYCAPACGGGCKYSAFLAMKGRCKRLAQRLGRGWTVAVYENLGWHGRVVSACGRIKVSLPSNIRDTYSAVLSNKDDAGGIYWGHNKVPRKAVLGAIREAEEHLSRIKTLLKGLR